MLEQLAKADADASDDLRLFVLTNPVRDESVIYAIDEAFMKATA